MRKVPVNINYPKITKTSKSDVHAFINQLIEDLSANDSIELVSEPGNISKNKLFWRIRDDINEVGQWKELIIRSDDSVLSSVTSLVLWVKSNSPERSEVLAHWRADNEKLNKKELDELDAFVGRIYIKSEKQKLEKVIKQQFADILEQYSESSDTDVLFERNNKGQIIVDDLWWNEEPAVAVLINLCSTKNRYKLAHLHLVYRKDEEGHYHYLGCGQQTRPFYEKETNKCIGSHLLVTYPDLSPFEVQTKLNELSIPADIIQHEFEFNNRGIRASLKPTNYLSRKGKSTYELLNTTKWSIEVFHPKVKAVNVVFYSYLARHDDDRCYTHAYWICILKDDVDEKATSLEVRQRVYLKEGVSFVDNLNRYIEEHALENIEAILHFFGSNN